MDLQFLDNTERHQFEAHTNGKRVGFIAYKSRGEALEMTHTEVDPALEGQDIGAALVGWALEQVQKRDREVIPTCILCGGFCETAP